MIAQRHRHLLTTDAASYPATFYCNAPGCNYSERRHLPSEPNWLKEKRQQITGEVVEGFWGDLEFWDLCHVDTEYFMVGDGEWIGEVIDWVEEELELFIEGLVSKTAIKDYNPGLDRPWYGFSGPRWRPK